jgi:hypothetical protein
MPAEIPKRPTMRARLLAIGTVLVLAWGCGAQQPMRPTALTPEILPAPPRPALSSRAKELEVDAPGTGTAIEVIDDTVTPAAERTLAGGRYELAFPVGAVGQATQVKLTEPDSSKILFELEPHGAQFAVPVVLTIDYRGTNADPDSPNYDGSMPVLYWFDDRAAAWVEVRGVSDVGDKRHIVQLDHFSTYSLSGRARVGGKGGW